MSPRGDVLIAVGSPERDHAPKYRAALELAGVPAERIRVIQPEGGRDDRALGAEALGLVLAGGEDPDPALYGEATIPEAAVDVFAERDAMELALLAGAREAAVATWGICRGLQVINVFLGGTLWQDIPLQLPTAVAHDLPEPKDALVHAVTLDDPRGTLGRLFTREAPWVNSRHHQGVKELGRGLVATARSRDGLVEAVALDAPGWWLRAVQWHPEDLTPMARERALWRAFAETLGFSDQR
jgi:putative glutamine amidotransferase